MMRLAVLLALVLAGCTISVQLPMTPPNQTCIYTDEGSKTWRVSCKATPP